MTSELRFFVPGIPASQGSMKCVGVDRRTGRHLVVPDNPPKLNEWRKAVRRRAEGAAEHQRWTQLQVADIRMLFRLTRPKGHYRDGRYSHLLRDDAPDYPSVKGIDLDKAIRAIYDAITHARVIIDDACIVTSAERKRYCLAGQIPGVNVVLSEPPRLQLALDIGATA